jgi:hypothetical protein
VIGTTRLFFSDSSDSLKVVRRFKKIRLSTSTLNLLLTQTNNNNRPQPQTSH